MSLQRFDYIVEGLNNQINALKDEAAKVEDLEQIIEDEANNLKGQISALGHALSDMEAEAAEMRSWLASCPWEVQ